MSLPYFYMETFVASVSSQIILDEEVSRHVVQVLRMQSGEFLHLTNGKGLLVTAVINEPHKKHCTVTVSNVEYTEDHRKPVYIGISLLKNPSRFEWFLEKATELGVAGIIPLRCERTEKQHVRIDRMKTVLISAMLQSKQTRIPDFYPLTHFNKLFQLDVYNTFQTWNKCIAFCGEGFEKKGLQQKMNSDDLGRLILIGPEGDFTQTEIEQAMLNGGCAVVSMGTNRLRTETAGVAAATLLCML